MSAITTVIPATEEEIQTYTLMTEQEATDQIEACHAVFLEWRKLTHQERAPFLTKIGQMLREHRDELAALMTRKTGKLLTDGHLENAFVAQMKSVTMGDPKDDGTQLGPLASQEQFDTIKKQVDDSVAKGAKILCGGEAPDRTGAYYPATALADLTPGIPAYDDEIFGPVASIIRASDDADAMRIANESRYCLGGGIFCKDDDRAFRLARDHFDTGMIRINSFGVADPNMPFGGIKDSGFGRDHGGFGMEEFVNVKAIFLP